MAPQNLVDLFNLPSEIVPNFLHQSPISKTLPFSSCASPFLINPKPPHFEQTCRSGFWMNPFPIQDGQIAMPYFSGLYVFFISHLVENPSPKQLNDFRVCPRDLVSISSPNPEEISFFKAVPDPQILPLPLPHHFIDF